MITVSKSRREGREPFLWRNNFLKLIFVQLFHVDSFLNIWLLPRRGNILVVKSPYPVGAGYLFVIKFDCLNFGNIYCPSGTSQMRAIHSTNILSLRDIEFGNNEDHVYEGNHSFEWHFETIPLIYEFAEPKQPGGSYPTDHNTGCNNLRRSSDSSDKNILISLIWRRVESTCLFFLPAEPRW